MRIVPAVALAAGCGSAHQGDDAGGTGDFPPTPGGERGADVYLP